MNVSSWPSLSVMTLIRQRCDPGAAKHLPIHRHQAIYWYLRRAMESPFAGTLRICEEGAQRASQVADRRPLLAVYSWSFEAADHVRFVPLIATVPFCLQQIRSILQDHLDKCAHAASQHIDSLIEQEQEPFTMNTHYYMEYRSKFLAYYRGARQRAKSDFMRNLENSQNHDIRQALNDALSSLTRMGLEAVDASSLANLLPPDPMEPAIGIMADARAYFQGSEHIFSFALTVIDLTCITPQSHTNGSWTTFRWELTEHCCGE